MEISLPTRALLFAARAHDGQYRKGDSNEPYICHPIRVAEMIRVRCAFGDYAIAAALLHDVVEDCKITEAQLEAQFGPEVTRMVMALSDLQTPEDGNRATRMANVAKKMAQQDYIVQTIKVADVMDNVGSIVAYNRAFARKYVPEKKALLAVLTKADPVLLAEANQIIVTAETDLKEPA